MKGNCRKDSQIYAMQIPSAGCRWYEWCLEPRGVCEFIAARMPSPGGERRAGASTSGEIGI